LILIGISACGLFNIRIVQAANSTVIAVAGPMSGPIARFGTQMKEGAEKAVAEINAHGGVLGRPLKLVVEVLYYAGNFQEAAEVIKEARAAGLSLQLLGSDAFYTDLFLRAAGPAADGTMFTAEADANPSAQANETHDAAVRTYAAVQLWAAAVAKAGTTDANKVAEILRTGSWNTALGPLSFDAKGDPVKPDYAWYLVKDGSIREVGK
jgi:branched-chain amino acid transport system substrate-binding protein